MESYDANQLKKIQKVDLQMAEFFVKYCQDNNLLCYFCGGGCIGAVRHKGFIPWDDDLDFFMPRSDYERLKQIWRDTERYALRFPCETYNDHNMFMTLRDKFTTMIKPFQKDMDIIHGITMDIFPLDGCPARLIKRIFQLVHGLEYQLFCTQTVPENHGRLVKLVGKLGLFVCRSQKIRYKIWKRAEKKMMKYEWQKCDKVTEICAGPKYMRNKYEKQWFEKAEFTEFEGTMMPIPVGYDGYLRMAFGDYLQLPPEEKRVPSHDSLVVDTERPYTYYVGQGARSAM